MRNLHLTFVLCSASQKQGGDFAKFCGFLRIYELYIFPSLDGLDAKKQSFTGSINTKPKTFHSHGAMDYETVILITDKETEYNDNEFHETGRKWPQVKTTFVLKRRAFQHILQTFFPACCLGPHHLLSFF